jgi:hypothetical protein
MRGYAIRWTAFALPGLLPLMIARRRRLIARLRTMSMLLLLCGAGLWFTGCGSSGGNGGKSPGTPVTPSGNYTIQVVASGPAGASTSNAVNVIVQ